MRRRPTRPGMTRVGTAGTPVPRRTGSAFEGRPAPRPAPMPTRGGMGMNPSGPAPRPAPMPTRGGMVMNPSGPAPRPAPTPTPMPTRGGMGMNPSGPAPRPAPVRPGMKKGGKVKKIKKGGSVSSCSKRADGCIIKGKTKGRII